jgi:mycofactocin precursor
LVTGHAWTKFVTIHCGGHRTRQNREVRGGTVSIETLSVDEVEAEVAEVEELLVEEVSIDGLCGVY